MHELEGKFLSIKQAHRRSGLEGKSQESFETYEQINYYEDTKSLLENYRELEFFVKESNALNRRLEESTTAILNELHNEREDFTNLIIKIAADDLERRQIYNIYILTQVGYALAALKRYPHDGPFLHDLIMDKYIREDTKYYSYDKLAIKNHKSRQTIMKKTKKAIEIMSEMIWGNMINSASVRLVARKSQIDEGIHS